MASLVSFQSTRRCCHLCRWTPCSEGFHHTPAVTSISPQKLPKLVGWQYLMHRNTPPSKTLELSLIAAAVAHLLPPLALLCILLAAKALRRLQALIMQQPSYACTPRVGIEIAALILFFEGFYLDFKDDQYFTSSVPSSEPSSHCS